MCKPISGQDIVNGLFKGWKENRTDLDFSKQTFNEMWKDRFSQSYKKMSSPRWEMTSFCSQVYFKSPYKPNLDFTAL
jgi:hypothetical protein